MNWLLIFLFSSSAASVDPTKIEIPYQEIEVNSGPAMFRKVQFQVPEGTPPKDGWPVVVMYQGTNHPVKFSRTFNEPYGLYYEAQLILILLRSGFAVVAPRALWDVGWVTNTVKVGYEFTSDYIFINNVLEKIKEGAFGKLNPRRVFATGISSGGYNTSRMAVSFSGKFRALAVQCASYATCLGSICRVPNTLPIDHPPTLLLHGEKDADVPLWTVQDYHHSLVKNHISTYLHIDPNCGHEWCKVSPQMILNWFKKYL